ncbi:MAG: hypothetical protein CFE50_00235 [Pseudomonas sp. PGPPP4]|uniref:AAA domain-containing protein n=1 Tax=Pseudomonas sp. PGPPP4 TaxID=2015556 RepID=UPI000BCE4B85|nr:AAA domain-containing protein [Pseudomonas sp. PGPPP4]OYT85820.1 MAG: hypothetical protein CFE50_00235 [Pseudomonas sp. PGPPP4]
MKIIVRGQGLHGSETKAVARMEAELRDSWHAYASVLVTDSQGSMEFDLLIVTHDRLLVVELKNWNGELTSYNGNWYVNGKRRSKSPYHTKRDQALRLLKIIQTELQHKLGFYPSVEAHVVMCGTSKPATLQPNDRLFVHTLDEFMTIRGEAGYAKLITGHQFLRFDGINFKRPNDPANLKHFDAFFTGTRVEPATFKIKGYRALTDTPDHQHGNGLFSEYSAEHEKYHNQKALIRRWDLTVLGLIHREDAIWQRIVTREDHLYRTASATNSTLQNYMLRPIEAPDEDNIGEDCVAAYELKSNTRRLSDFIAGNAHKWSPEQKLDIVRALLQPFAEMHTMSVAHRDIQPQVLWYAEDSAHILVSGFHNAFLPEKGTVKELSSLIKSNQSLLPEDVYGEDGDIHDPFAQDVYLLAIVAHKICFPDQKMKTEEGLCVWTPVENDPFEGKLDAFFAKAMDLEHQNRFANAADMHATFNTIALGDDRLFDDNAEVIAGLTAGDFIKSDLSPFYLITHFPPIPGAAPPLMGEKIAYRCTVGGEQGYLKFWQKAAIDGKNPGINRRLLRMRMRIETAINNALPITQVLKHGMFGQGEGLFIVTRYEEGQTWADYVGDLVMVEERLGIAQQLCDIILKIHASEFAHGDLHPDNVLVQTSDAEEGIPSAKLVLIDALDWGGASEPHNTSYGPSNPAATDSFGRDKFAVYRMVAELFGDEIPVELESEIQAAAEQPYGVPVELGLLKACIDQLLAKKDEPEKPEEPPIRLVFPNNSLPEQPALFQESGLEYHLNVQISDKYVGELFCTLTGNYQKLRFRINPEKRFITTAWIEETSLHEYAQAAFRAAATFTRPVMIQRGLTPHNLPDSLLNFVLNQDDVIDLLDEMFGLDEEGTLDLDESETVAQTIKPHHIWQALLKTEGEQRLKVEVGEGAITESKTGHWHIPCVLKSGNELDFSGGEDEEIGIYLASDQRHFGWVVPEESGGITLAVKPQGESLGSFRKKIPAGTELFFESKLNHASRFRRQRAMDSVLAGKARIPSLPSYFDEEGEISARPHHAVPSEESIRSRYDNYKGSPEVLNPQQIVAFQQVISRAPLQVIQGPPGTGKTSFVSKLIDYLFSNNLARNILLVGQSHTSVDTVAIKARELCEEMGNTISVVRLGREHQIDEKLLQCHPSALQMRMQHKFQREYEKRINALAKRLLLDKDFVEEVAKLHRSISPLLARIATLGDKLLLLEKRGEQTTDYHIKKDEYSRGITDGVAIVENIIRTRGYEFSLPEVVNPGYWKELVRQIAIMHGVTNQLALQRLMQLITISKDWIDVLTSGQGSFDQFFVKTSQLVTGTLVGMGARWLNIEEQSFDWVIVDEAGRAQASELMIVLQCAKRALLVGDHRQLPPHYDNHQIKHVARHLKIDEAEVKKTDFERAFIANDGVTLDTQYRMIEPIGEVISHCFYGGKLRSHREAAKPWFSELPYPMNKPVSWIDSGSGARSVWEEDLSKGSGKYINIHEMQVCMDLLRKIANSSSLDKLKETKSEKHPYPIGIIVMYSAQKKIIETEMSRQEWMAPLRDLIDIATVDSYQGQERQIIILNLVRHNPQRKQGFLIEPSRINVSLSRAQERLVIIGSKQMWEAGNQQSALADVLGFIAKQIAAGKEEYELVDGTTVIEGNRHV